MAKVIIFEDDEMLRAMYERKFQSTGFEVVSKEDATDVVKDVKEAKASIVLMDVLMPKVDGFTAIKLLKEDSATRKIPILVTSNLSDQTTIQKSLWLGASDVIVKADLTPTQLVQKTKDVLAGKAPAHKLNPELIKFLHLEEQSKSTP